MKSFFILFSLLFLYSNIKAQEYTETVRCELPEIIINNDFEKEIISAVLKKDKKGKNNHIYIMTVDRDSSRNNNFNIVITISFFNEINNKKNIVFWNINDNIIVLRGTIPCDLYVIGDNKQFEYTRHYIMLNDMLVNKDGLTILDSPKWHFIYNGKNKRLKFINEEYF